MMNLFKVVSLVAVLVIIAYCIFSKKDNVDILCNIADKYSMVMLACIVLIGAFVRFYKITLLPAGLHADEYAIAYDAWAHSVYGVERHLMHNPVYLINYGGGQNTLLFYMLMLSYKLFGNEIFAIRFPTAFMGSIAILVLYGIGTKIKDRATGLLAAFLTAVFPALINMSRFGLESYLFYSMFALALLTIILAVDAKSYPWFFIAGILFGLTLYSYAVSYIVVPLFLAITFVYLLWIKKITIPQIVVMGVPLGILALPLITMLVINKLGMDSIVLPFITIPRLPEFRAGEISLLNIRFVFKSLKSIFLNDWLNYNSDPVFNTMYIVSIPLIAFGLILTIKKAIEDIKNKNYGIETILLAGFTAVFIQLSLVSEVNVNKANAIYPFLVIFAAVALRYIAQKTTAGELATLVIYAMFFLRFTADYFSPQSYTWYKDLFTIMPYNVAENIAQINPDAQVCLLDKHYNSYPERYAFASKMSPYELNEVLFGNSDNKKFIQSVPVWRDEDDNIVENFSKDTIYVVQLLDGGETFTYICDRLQELNYSCIEADSYKILYYKN